MPLPAEWSAAAPQRAKPDAMDAVRGRFAPSPTGELHLGNARTALLAWLWAKQTGGGFTLRIEDLDRARERPGMAQRQVSELAWLGIDWDEGPDARTGADAGARGPYRQSQRTRLYEDAVRALGDEVYECFCSRAEIAAAANAPHGDEGPRYPGTCATLSRAQRSERRRTRVPALRFRVAPGAVRFDDEIQGPQEFDVQAGTGDFVLRRADGIHAYQLAVVVDDAAMGISQVLRGADLLSSTARQILLYRALGFATPRWAHAPLVVAATGERLAKRDRALSLEALRGGNVDPRRIADELLRLSGQAGAPGQGLGERARSFDLGKVPKSPLALPDPPW
jgi:glutamyl-tRNA synthetase